MKGLIVFLFIFSSAVAEEDASAIFNSLYNAYGGKSGGGSSLEQTTFIMEVLPSLIKKYDCKSMLDLGCGDYAWMRFVSLPLEKYIGADVMSDLIRSHQLNFGDSQREFIHLDALQGPLPTADIIFCRDFLVHYSNAQIIKIIKKIKASGAKYLLTTTFPKRSQYKDRPSGDWRPLNLTDSPFNFPEPLVIINEHCTQFISGILWDDKSLGLWEVSQLPKY